MTTYNFFYPENNEKFPLPDFETAEDALRYWRDKRYMWEVIKPTDDNDVAAFMNPITGDIVVLRETKEVMP